MSEDCAPVAELNPQPGSSNENQPTVQDKDEGGSSPGRSSPEGNCPICLGKVENKSFTDSCFHQFCFLCLVEWSKVKAECPLCKRIFKSIIHTVRSLEDYEQYHLHQTQQNLRTEENEHVFRLVAWHTPTRREPFRYRTTAVNSYLDYVVRLEQAMTHHVDHVLPSFPPTLTSRTHYTRRRQNGTSDFRRNIYQQGLWVQVTTDVTGRVRDCSPEFFRANPAQSHRLVPWLNRELNVLCGGNQVQQVLDQIMVLITEVPIRSAAFSTAVSRHIGRHTDHFVHEFHCFATSPYDLIGYDRHASYITRSAMFPLDNESDGNDSDVQIVGSAPSTVPPIHLLDSDHSSDSDDVMIVEATGSSSRSEAPPPASRPIEVVTLSDDDVVQVNISLNVCSENESKKPMKKRRKLRRNWVTVSDLNLPSTSRDTMNVSINIERSRTSSTSSDSSSSSWSPQTSRLEQRKKRKKDSKTKGKKSHKSSKIKFTLSNKGKSLEKHHMVEPSSAVDTEPSTSGEQLKPVEKQEPLSEEDIDVLRIETDQELSSSDESEYKHKLKSVVFKSEVKLEHQSPKREVSPLNTPEDSPYPSPRYSSSSSIKSVSMSSDNDSSDLYKPSCSFHPYHSTRKHQNRDKFRPSKKCKRDYS